jgi:oleate hydratase
VDFQFDTKITDVVTAGLSGRRVSRLELIQNGFQLSINLGPHDIVIANLGSTISGTAVGSNEKQPYTSSNESLDENWTIWLELCSKAKSLGNPYCFCCRRFESMMESFTITTEDLTFFNHLISMSCSSFTVGTILILRESRWKLNLCIPTQPVFEDQPGSVRVLWGFALSPEISGDYIRKPMVQCSGADITAELMHHLNFPPRSIFQRTVTIPRIMPRMSSLLLAHSYDERPKPINPDISNLGLVGEFVEISQYSCIDMSYGLRAAKSVVSGLTGANIPKLERKRSRTRLLLQIFLWK